MPFQPPIFIVCDSDFFIESKQTFICTEDKIPVLLADPGFLEQNAHRFDRGITGFTVLPYSKLDGAKVLRIAYHDHCDDIEETDFFLLPTTTFIR